MSRSETRNTNYPENPRLSNPFPRLFLASDPDKLKEFNNHLSETLIKEMDEAYKILAAGEVEKYVADVNNIIARNFDIEEKITALDLFQDVGLVESLQEGLKCTADKITTTGSFATNQDAIPVLNVIFPEFDYTKKCLPEIPEYPVDTPLTVPEETSYVSSFNQLLANALFGKVGKEDLHCAISNPPELNISWLNRAEVQSDTLTYQKFKLPSTENGTGIYSPPSLYPQQNLTTTKNYSYSCTIPPFFQNYILSADQLSEAGGKKHFIFNSPAANASEPLFFHYIGAALDDSENAAYVNKIGGNKMFFVKNSAFNPAVLLHETMHWLGVKHAQHNTNLQSFLRSWGIKVGDPYPSISGYSSIILGNDKNFRNYIADTDLMRGDNRQSYLRPFDVLLLEALRHKRMVCLPEREAAGYVVDDANITRSTGQECAAKYISELEKHSFETLPSSSQRILAQSFQRIAGVEIPITLAEIALQSLYESSTPNNEREQRVRNYVISKNGIETLRTVIRSGINLLTMGVRPMAAAVVLESGVHATAAIGQKVCKTISEKTGFSDSSIAKRLEENANYISTYVPEDVRKFLFGMAMVYAVNYIQYSDYVKGYSSNYDMSAREIPDPSIKASEAMITSCLVAVISAVISSGLRSGAKKLKENYFAENPARVVPAYHATAANRDISRLHDADDDIVLDIELGNQSILKDEKENSDESRHNQIAPMDSKDDDSKDDDILNIEIPDVSPRIKPTAQNSSASKKISECSR